MKQTFCKCSLILFLNLCFIAFTSNAQDSSKTATTPPAKTPVTAPVKSPKKTTVTAPAKTIVKPPVKVVNPPVQTVSKVPAKPIDSSLKGQYEDLLRHSWMQKGYKVIDPTRLNTLWKSVNDSLNRNKRLLTATNQKLDQQAKQINELRNTPGTTNSAIAGESVSTAEQIQVLGMTVDVVTYNWVVWGAIVVLALGLAGVLFTTTKSSHEARHHKQLYEEISSEYNTYKTKAKEKELKLARELQTERNNLEELLAKKDPDPGRKA
jgi:hypothetical protein